MAAILGVALWLWASGAPLPLVEAAANRLRRGDHGYPARWRSGRAGLPLDLTGYRLAWRDEFDSLSVAGEGGHARWYAPGHSRLGLGRLADPGDPALSVQDGRLALSTRGRGSAEGVDANLQSADGRGNGFFLVDGYVEARVKLPNAAGGHAGLWLLSPHDDRRGHAEIDVLETYGPGSGGGHHHTVHFWPGTSSAYRNHVFNAGYGYVRGLQTGWRDLGVMLTRDWIVIAVDRREVARIARKDDRRPLYLLLSNFTDPGRKDGYRASTMLVDWVRVYEPAPPRLSF